MSATIRARSAGVTAGVTPNQRSKPGTAWCSSMPSPSTVAMPARARLRAGAASRAARRRCRRRSRRAASPARSRSSGGWPGHAERGGVDEEVGLREQRRRSSRHAAGAIRLPARRPRELVRLAAVRFATTISLERRARAGPRRRPAPRRRRRARAPIPAASQPARAPASRLARKPVHVGVVAVQAAVLDPERVDGLSRSRPRGRRVGAGERPPPCAGW